MKNATAALAALGQTTRLAIFRLLVEAGPSGRRPGEIAEALGLPGATLSFHLKELGAAGLVRGEALGRSIHYSADFAAMDALVGFLTHNCCGGDPAACGPVPRSAAMPASTAPTASKRSR